MNAVKELNDTIALLDGALKMMDQIEAQQKELIARGKKYHAALEEIKDYAEYQYDGPEDRRMGWILSRVRDALGH